MKAHKIEIFVVDHDDYGADEYVSILENHRHLSASIGEVTTIEIGEWDDGHPLNRLDTDCAEYFREAIESGKLVKRENPS